MYFNRDDPDKKDAVNGMPEIYQYGINHLKEMLFPLIKKGLRSVLLLGVNHHLEKVLHNLLLKILYPANRKNVRVTS